jgi:hypothetical protein
MVDSAQVEKIRKGVEVAGLWNKFPEKAMICLVDKNYIHPNCLSNGDALTFKCLQFADDVTGTDVQLDFIAGQTRHNYLITVRFCAQLALRNKLQHELEEGNLAAEKRETVIAKLKEVHNELKECVWLVSFYDKSEFAF